MPWLACRAEPAHDDPRRIGMQIQGLSVQETGLGQDVRRSVLSKVVESSGVQGPKRRQFRAIPADAGKLANLGEAE